MDIYVCMSLYLVVIKLDILAGLEKYRPCSSFKLLVHSLEYSRFCGIKLVIDVMVVHLINIIIGI